MKQHRATGSAVVRAFGILPILGAALVMVLNSTTYGQTDPADIGRWIEPPRGVWYEDDPNNPYGNEDGFYGWEPEPEGNLLRAEYAMVLPRGNVLVWSGPGAQWLWHPKTGDFTNVTHSHSGHTIRSCAGHAAMPDGSMFVAGGGPSSNPVDTVHIFDVNATEGPWINAASLPEGRFYPTITTLSDGTMLATGGRMSDGNHAEPAIYDPDTDSWTSTGIGPANTQNYPMMFVIPDGRLLFAGPQPGTRLLDLDQPAWVSIGNNLGWVGGGKSVAMFQPGQVVVAGGREVFVSQILRQTTTRTAFLDVSDDPENATWDDDPVHYMNHDRFRFELVTLPNGNVLAVGGEHREWCWGYWDDDVLVCEPFSQHPEAGWQLKEYAPVMHAEWIDPNAPLDGWTELAEAARPRPNHSVALLLPDATVLAAGGKSFVDFPAEPTAEIFEPPYLFSEGDQYAPRPKIGWAPRKSFYDATFEVKLATGITAEQISAVNLVRPGAVTHYVDQNQRFVPLEFEPDLAPSPPDTLHVAAPANANLAPPGYYMLFVIDNNGVPSEAHFIRLDLHYVGEP